LGLLAGLFGCLFGILGIFTFGIVFVPLAALCAVIGLARGIGGGSAAGMGTSILAGLLSVVGFAVSPSLWLVAGGLLVASQSDRPAAPTTASQQIVSPPANLTVTRPSGVQVAGQKNINDCDRLAGHPYDPTRVSDGIPFDKIDTDKAILSCAQAVRDNPTEARFSFEYGRALDAAKQYDNAIRWYRAAAEQSYLMAQIGLATMYQNGRGVPKDFTEAMRLARKVADQGNSFAQNFVGNLYDSSDRAQKNYAEALRWFRKAADQGFDVAQSNLGNMYLNGRGVTQNDAEAVKWYRKAADQGNAVAQNNVGAMLAKGQGVPHDDAESVKWYRLAADQGLADAQSNLGFAYARGQGVPQDYAEAFRWHYMAAEHGNAAAQKSLGALYAGGQGVQRDYVEAMKWTRKAADQGNAEAQYNLGAMYYNGQGASQNDSEAMKWFQKAAEQGYAAAKEIVATRNPTNPAQSVSEKSGAIGTEQATFNRAKFSQIISSIKQQPNWRSIRTDKLDLDGLGYSFRYTIIYKVTPSEAETEIDTKSVSRTLLAALVKERGARTEISIFLYVCAIQDGLRGETGKELVRPLGCTKYNQRSDQLEYVRDFNSPPSWFR
jgi:TPR repeat protein